MSVLALDLGSHAGWAVFPSFVSGVWVHKAGRYDGGGMRYLRFRSWLSEIAASLETPLTAVYFEEVRAHKGVDAAHVYGGLLAHLTAWCEEHEIPYEGIPVQTIKKHATGKGNANKEAMVRRASAILGVALSDKEHDRADAVCLLDYVVATRLPASAAKRSRVRVKT